MADAQAPDHQEADQQHHHPHRTVVAIERGVAEQNADPALEVDGDQKRRNSSRPPWAEIFSPENTIGRSLLTRARIRFLLSLTNVAPRCGC